MLDEKHTQPGVRRDLDPEVVRNFGQHEIQEVLTSRTHERRETALEVCVRQANTSESSRLELHGVTADLSRGGCRLILPLPTGVGDVFRIEFESSSPSLRLVFARCLRCRLVREDVFEAGFSFFAPIDLPEEPAGAAHQPRG
jgi:hypothetical protein